MTAHTETEESAEQRLWTIVSTDLTPEQSEQILRPSQIHPRQKEVMGLHWHPEHVPMDLIRERVSRMFPGADDSLLIPTQHNEMMSYDNVYAGLEIDCFSVGFNQKVQLLVHMRKERADSADILKAMAEYTYRYRATQLLDMIRSITRPNADRMERAARKTGADPDLLALITRHAGWMEQFLDRHQDRVPTCMIKNKLLVHYFDTLRPRLGDAVVDRIQAFLAALKVQVKREFPLSYFYRTQEVIEEARGCGAGIVIPHPEQFWPILLADYDVDGIEVWNPQSQTYTDFLISVINTKNSTASISKRLLIFMGDDTHMSEKLKPPHLQNVAKSSREVGFQPGWNELGIRKQLILAGMDRNEVISEYRDRLN